jgi:hypothetical protein
MAALYAGLAITAVAVAVPYLDRATSDTLAQHIRAGYPTYAQARADLAATVYLVYLSVIGAAGAACWLIAAHAVKTHRRWARGVATVLFIIGTAVALTNLLIRDTSGITGLPPLLGWVGMLPCLPGLVAVTLLWRRP